MTKVASKARKCTLQVPARRPAKGVGASSIPARGDRCSAYGRCCYPPLVCETARSARGRVFSPPPHLAPAPPPRPVFPLSSRLVPAPPLRPVFPSFPASSLRRRPAPSFPSLPASPLQYVVAIPSLPSFRSVRSRCLGWDETAVFPGFCAVSVLEMGRDCCFSGVMCGLGAREGTRLLLFLGFVRSRCSRRDETAVFPGFCAVSVLEMGRDCCFSGVMCGLGAREGTRLLLFLGFVRSRCSRRDETAAFLGFCAVSVSEKGRDCRYRFKCVPRLVGGSLTVRLSAKTASQSCCCLRGVAVLPLYSRRWEWRNGMLVLQDGTAAVKCKALSPWAL